MNRRKSLVTKSELSWLVVPNRRLGLLLAACAACSLSSCPSRPETPHLNVILITVDTLRADHLGCYGNSSVATPAMDSLARDGVLFAKAISQVPLTGPSHAAILTGTYPMWNGFRGWLDRGLPAGVPTVPEAFRAHDYTTAAFVSAFVLDSMWGLNRGFDVYDDRFKTQDYQTIQRGDLRRRGEETIDHAVAWLRSRRPAPFFLWVHLYDPHLPYDPPEPFKTRYRDRPYDGEVAYADQQLGRLFAFLKSQDLYASGLIVLTSDHGEGLGEHLEWDHGFFVYNSTAHVPLIVKLPSSHAPLRRRVSEVVNTLDIAPTLTRVSGFPDAETRSFQGQSLLSLMDKEGPPRYGFSESTYAHDAVGAHTLFGVQTSQYHYVRGAEEELYDLEHDPAELHNIVHDKPAVTQTLRQTLEAIRSRFHQPGEASGQTGPSPETVEKLRSLGYVSVASAKSVPEDDPKAPDPKLEIDAYNKMLRAMTLAESGRYREANLVLETLKARHPQLYMIPLLEAENYYAMGQAREAITYYRRALELNPGSGQAAVGLGAAAYQAVETDEAAKAYELALQLNPNDFMTRLALAKVYWRLNKLDVAAAQQRAVIQSHPQFAQAYAEHGETLVQMRRFTEALPALQKGIDLGYRDAMVYNVLGNTLAALGNTKEARPAYETAIQLDAKYVDAYANLAVIYIAMGQEQKARQYFQDACRLNDSVCRQLAPRFR